MDLFLLLSLLATFAASLVAEQAVFPATEIAATRFLRAFGIYAGLLIMLAYFCTYYVPMPLSPAFLLLAAIALAAASLKFGKRGAQTDFSPAAILPPLALFGAALLLFLVPSMPTFFPISWGMDAANHFNFMQAISANLLGSQPPLPHFIGNTVYPFGLHIMVVLYSIALGIGLMQFAYPAIVLIIGLTAAAFYSIIHSKTKDNWLALFAGLMLLLSNYTYVALWGNGTWSQILAQLLILIFVLGCMEFIRSRSLAALAVMALSVQALILTHTFLVFITLLMVPPLLALREWQLRISAKEVAVFLLVALAFPIPYFYEYFNYATEMRAVLNYEGAVTNDIAGSLGMPAILLFAAAVAYAICNKFLLRGKYDFRDDLALRLLMLSTAASLITLFIGAACKVLIWYWFYKLWLLAIYPLILYSVLFLDRIVERAAPLAGRLAHVSTGYARFSVLGLIIVAWVLYPALSPSNIMTEYHQVLTPDEYSAAMWLNASQGIHRVSVIPNSLSSFTWMVVVSGKASGISWTDTCFFDPSTYFVETSNCVAGLISCSDNESAVFVQNYKAVAGLDAPRQGLAEVSGVCANVAFNAGNATVLTKARNTAVRLDNITLTEGGLTTSYNSSGCSHGCFVQMHDNQTGVLLYNFTQNGASERIYLRIFEPSAMGRGATSVFVSTDAASWKRVPLEDLRPVLYDSRDISSLVGTSSRNFYVRVEFTGIEFERVAFFLGANSVRAVELVGCSER